MNNTLCVTNSGCNLHLCTYFDDQVHRPFKLYTRPLYPSIVSPCFDVFRLDVYLKNVSMEELYTYGIEQIVIQKILKKRFIYWGMCTLVNA